MSQREKLKDLMVRFCNNKGSRTFSLQELNEEFADYSEIEIGGKTPQATVRRLLQELRNENFISFKDNSGHYTLRGIELLNDEKEDIKNLDISNENSNRREYLVETYARNIEWVKQAKEIYGLFCMMDNCGNTFW